MKTAEICRAAWYRCDQSFHEQYTILWPNLSRLLSLMAVLNVSVFFLTGAVTRGGYHLPVVALALLGTAEVLILLPFGWQARLGFYLFVLTLCVSAGVLLGTCIGYWVVAGGSM